MSSAAEENFQRLHDKFHVDMHDMVKLEKHTGRIYESGQPRVALRGIVIQLMKIADAQLSTELQVKLLLYFAAEFFKCGEYALAVECYDTALSKCEVMEDVDSSKVVRQKVSAIQSIVRSNSIELNSIKYCCIAPMTVSKLLLCLQKLRSTLETVFTLTTKQQEENSWLILNSSKLILEISQPLVWLNCGKYVTESVFFSAICMESVINLCTVRHMKFRMKLYLTAFYSTLSQGSIDEASAIFQHTTKQCMELKEREELDPPLPDKTVLCIDQCMLDLAIMRFVMEFWKDPDSLNFSSEHLDKRHVIKHAEIRRSFLDLCICECIRLHFLTSGNINEPYRKRSANIIRAVTALFSSYQIPSKDSAEEAEGTTEVQVDSLVSKLSIFGLFEILCVVVFDSSEPSNAELVTKICSVAESVVQTQTGMQNSDYHADIELLQKVYLFQQVPVVEEKFAAIQEVLSVLESTLFSERAYRKKSFLKKVVLIIWQRYLYPLLQSLLSSFDSESATKDAVKCAEAFLLTVKVFDAVFIEDPILHGGIVLLSANVLWRVNDKRQSISVLRQGISAVEEHRAALVDIAIHMPEDARDILALQRASFTSRADSADWFHSVKRLGAQAFAGYGIFGLSSSADRMAQALAEIHADLLSLYFKFELEYAVQQKQIKNGFVMVTSSNAILNPTSSPTKNDLTKSIATKSTVTKGGKNTIKNPNKTNQLATIQNTMTSNYNDDVELEKFHTVYSLRSYCLRNSYSKCLLLLEMARCESQREDKCLDYLVDAMKCIEEAEGREQMLKTSFSNHTILTDNDMNRYPLVLARTHKFIYVTPVGCRKVSNASYYRVLAKERGSGTAVSIYNDDLSGCEKRVLVSELSHPILCSVKIGPLRPGEHYMFGCVAYNNEDVVVSNVSPSSPVVEALNPLPTIILWRSLAQTAEDLSLIVSSHRLYKEASLQVCSRFFLNLPNDLPPLVVGKGVNLFLVKESSLSMLAVQQSSPVLLQAFISSVITFETHCKKVFDAQATVNWNMRVQTQISYLKSLLKIACITGIAISIQSHDLILRCVHIGYVIAAELIRFDMIQSALFLQNPLATFAAALQTIPKSNWQELEHGLYCRVLCNSISVSLLNRNISPVIPILNNFYPEALETNASDFCPPKTMHEEYRALIEKAKDSVAAVHIETMLLHAKELLCHIKIEEQVEVSGKSSVGSLWMMPAATRYKTLENVAMDLVSTEKSAASTRTVQQLTEMPMQQSDFLLAILQLCYDLKRKGNAAESIQSLLKLLPIYDDFTSPNLRKILDRCGLHMLTSFAAKATIAAEAAVAAAASPSKSKAGGAAKGKGAPPPKVEEVVAPVEVVPETAPERFSQCSVEEDYLQVRVMGNIVLQLALQSFEDAAVLNNFPTSAVGPYQNIDPKSSVPSSPLQTSVEVKTEVAPTGRIDFIRSITTSVQCFCHCNDFFSAIFASVKLFNYIINDWIDSESFAAEFQHLQPLTYGIILSLVEVIERNSSFLSPFDDTLQLRSHDSKKNLLTLQELKEGMLQVRDLLVFLVKVEWIQKDYQNVVLLGSRIFALYSSICPEYCKVYGDACLPLVIHSQEQLVAQAQSELDVKVKNMEDFITQYEDAQKKKRKKKLRVARTEKDDEELLFDSQKAEYQEEVDKAKDFLSSRKKELETAMWRLKTFEKLYSAGSQLLDKSRDLLSNFFKFLAADYGDEVDFKSLLHIDSVKTKYDQTVRSLTHTVNFLREKKDRVILIEALKVQADFMLLFGELQEARKLLHDLVDGLFNSIDACIEWPKVCDVALSTLENELVGCIIPVMVALGKLSKYCASSDMDAKAGYCRMAAELCKIPFSESVGHPSTAVGYCAYVCVELGGVCSFVLNGDVLAAKELVVALNEILRVLLSEQQFVVAMPVVTLLEYITAVYICSPVEWLNARCLRLKALVGNNMFAECISMVASISTTILQIQNQTFSDQGRTALRIESESLSTFETSKNALNFNKAPPFFNNLPPDNEEFNKKALLWLAAFANQDFEIFCNSIKVKLPVKELTAEEKEAAEKEALRLAQEAAEAAKKSKGKGKTSSMESAIPTASEATTALFSKYHVIEVQAICGQILLKLASLDAKLTVPHAASLKALGTSGQEIINKCIRNLYAILNEDPSNPQIVCSESWINLYGQCVLLSTRYQVECLRMYKEPRAMLSGLITLLCSDKFVNISGDVKGIVTHLWLGAKALLFSIAEKQARMTEAIGISNISAKEASIVYCGFWMRFFICSRARINFKLGNFSETLHDCEACIQQFKNNHLEDELLVRCLCLKASALHTRDILMSDSARIKSVFVECCTLLRTAKDIAQFLASQSGAFPADSNVTFQNLESSILSHNAMPPILHTFTELHSNDPNLSLFANLDVKKLRQAHDIIIRPELVGSNELFPRNKKDSDKEPYSLNNLRLGPVDSSEGVYSPSCFVNIYLTATRALVICHANLCLALGDARRSGCLSSIHGELLREEVLIGENGIKLLRHCIFAPTNARIALLSSVGRTRIENCSNYMSSKADLMDIVVGPLRAALSIAVNASHPWPLMVSVCIQLIDAFGDHNLVLGELDSVTRLKLAVSYLVTGIRLTNMFIQVTIHPISLTNDDSFSSPTSAELQNLVANSFSSSLSADNVSGAAVSAPAAPVPAPVAGKGKAPAAGKAAAAPPMAAATAAGGVNGRDAVFLLSALLKEADKLWPDGHEVDVATDLHCLLKKSYSAYASKCTLDKLPDLTTGVSSIPVSTISTLWSPAAPPDGFLATLTTKPNTNTAEYYSQNGVYSHISAFLLLGDKVDPVAAPAAPVAPVPAAKGAKVAKGEPLVPAVTAPVDSQQPILTKLVLPRVDVFTLEREVRIIRDQLIVASAKHAKEEVMICNEKFANCIVLLVWLLQNGTMYNPGSASATPTTLGMKAQYKIVESGSEFSLQINLSRSALSVSLPINEKLLLHLANVFSPQIAVDGLVDNDVCNFLRIVLGYS